MGFFDEVDGTQFESFEHVFVAAVARYHDHGDSMSRHEDAKERESIHARHFEVESHGLRLRRFDDAKGFFAPGSFANDTDPAAIFEDPPNAASVEGRVVDDDDLDSVVVFFPAADRRICGCCVCEGLGVAGFGVARFVCQRVFWTLVDCVVF